MVVQLVLLAVKVSPVPSLAFSFGLVKPFGLLELLAKMNTVVQKRG